MIMTTTALSRRTRLRSMVTGESFASARMALMLRGRSDSVVPEASAGQQEWEGLVFGSLRVVHFSGTTPLTVPVDALELSRVIPGEVGLRLDAVPGGAAAAMVDGVIPVLRDSEWSGVPGLRLQALDGAMVLYRLGASGSITITGVTVAEVRSAFRQRVEDGGSSPVWDSPRMLTPEERTGRGAWSHAGRGPCSVNELRMISCAVRRIGLLIGFGAYSIDLWRSPPDRIAVEAFFDELSPTQRDRVLAVMTSFELAPRLVPSMRTGSDQGRTRLEFDDRSCELDLRLRVG